MTSCKIHELTPILTLLFLPFGLTAEELRELKRNDPRKLAFRA